MREEVKNVMEEPDDSAPDGGAVNMEGWLIRGQGGVYTAEDETGAQYVLRAKNRFRRQRISPLVGDRICFTPGTISDEHGWIDEILPRTSAFVRPAVANVTMMAMP